MTLVSYLFLYNYNIDHGTYLENPGCTTATESNYLYFFLQTLKSNVHVV